MAGVTGLTIGQLVKSAGEFTIDNLTCDGVMGIGLQAISFLAQTELMVLSAQKRMAQGLRSEFDEDFSQLAGSFKKDFSEKLDAASTDSFDRWLMKQFEGNYQAGKDDPLSMYGQTQLVNSDSFSPFTGSDLTANEFNDVGPRTDYADPTCEASSGTGLSSTFTGAVGSALSLTKTAGKLAGLASALVQNPQTLLYGLIGALDTISELLGDGNLLLDNLIANAEQIVASFKDVRKQDYEQASQLGVFSTLLRTAMSDASAAENAVKQGVQNPPAAENLKDSLDKAAAWAGSLRGSRNLIDLTPKVTGWIMLLEQQINLYEQLSVKFARVNTNFVQGQATLPVQARFDPFFVNVYAQVRCQLSSLWAELLRTAQNQNLTLILKQVEWAASLKAMRTLVSSYSPQKMATDLSAQFASGFGFDLTTTMGEFDSLNQTWAPVTLGSSMISTATNFLNAAKNALKNYVDIGVLESLLDQMRAVSVDLKEAQDAFMASIAKFTGANEEQVEASRKFFTVLNTVKPFIPLVLALQEADYVNFFNTDTLTSSIETLRLRLLSKASECCADQQATKPDAQSQAGLREMRLRKNEAGREEKLGAYDRAFKEDVGTNAVSSIQARIQKVKSDIRQFERLFKLPCLGGPELLQRFF